MAYREPGAGARVQVAAVSVLMGLVFFWLPVFLTDPRNARPGLGLALVLVVVSSIWVGFGAPPLGGWVEGRCRDAFGSAAIDSFKEKTLTLPEGSYYSGRSSILGSIVASLITGLIEGTPNYRVVNAFLWGLALGALYSAALHPAPPG
jgi:hypothetical protein